jgi:hypothetical protein
MVLASEHVHAVMDIVSDYPPVAHALEQAGLAEDPAMRAYFSAKYVLRAMSIADTIAQGIGGVFRSVEIGCGLGIDTLALPSSLERKAFDIDSSNLPYWLKLSVLLTLGSIFSVESFYSWKLHYEDDSRATLLIADQPRSIMNDSSLERNIIRYAIERGFSIALVPYIREDEKEEREALETYSNQLSRADYDVGHHNIEGLFPQTLMFAHRR